MNDWQNVDLKVHDEAFLNSLLSYGVYTARKWTLENNAEHETSNIVLNTLRKANTTIINLNQKKIFELYTSFFMKEKFEAVNLMMPTQQTYISEQYGFETIYNTSTGDYEALNNLARAGIYRSKNEDGSYILHVSFRGTDTDARTFKSFVTDAYLDMSAYYDAFKPLEKYILAYVNNPDNKISVMHISGHSLGGSMVSEFFDSHEVKKCQIPKKGFTYGAPGNKKKKLYSFLPSLYHATTKGKFLEIGKSCLELLNPVLHNVHDEIIQYTHTGDLIPRVSNALYYKEGMPISLEDVAGSNAAESYLLTGQKLNIFKRKSKNFLLNSLQYTKYILIDKPKDYLLKVFHFEFHDMLRYIINIEHKASKFAKNYHDKENLEKIMPNVCAFNKYKNKHDIIFNNKEKTTIVEFKEKFILPNNKLVLENMEKIRSINTTKKIIKDISDKNLKISYYSTKNGKLLLKN